MKTPRQVISARANDGKNFGTILVAEGLLAAIPEFRTLIAELEGLPMPSTVDKVLPELTTWSAALFQSLPEFIQKQLLLARQSNAALQLSQLETERLMAWLVEDELKHRKKKAEAQVKPPTSMVANGWQRATKKLHIAQAMTQKASTINASKLRRKIAFLRAESDLNGPSSCRCLDVLTHATNKLGSILHEFANRIRNLDEPKRTSCLARVIQHKAFEAMIMLGVLANTIYIAYETNYEMVRLGELMGATNIVEIAFLVFFSVEMGVRVWVHGAYFFVNEDWSWNLMDAALVFLAYLDQILEYANASVGKVGMLRLLRVTRLFRIIRVLRFLKEVRVMLVAIVGSFISLFWALSMLAVIIFMFSVYFMQQMTTYLSSRASDPDELWQTQREYFNNLGATMYVLLMSSTGGKDWEEV
eukprot:Skav210249  [mRNA]  locus=scaffold1929:158282:169415:+ [translate_table: standard]